MRVSVADRDVPHRRRPTARLWRLAVSVLIGVLRSPASRLVESDHPNHHRSRRLAQIYKSHAEPKPGMDGMTRWKSADRGPITSRNSRTEPGQPWVRTSGSASGLADGPDLGGAWYPAQPVEPVDAITLGVTGH